MLEGRNLKIRAMRDIDLPSLYLLIEKSYVQNEFFINNLESEYHFKENFLKDGFWSEHRQFAVITNLKNEIIGSIYMQKSNIFDFCDLKYIIFEEKNRARGYTKEALFIFSNFLFLKKNINRIQLAIPNYHRASIAIAQKCFFTFEGIAKEAMYFNGEYLDLCIYSKLKRDLAKN
ncbi:MAG: hypothetical protein A3F40_00195 [Chlamydiae bacterium RIFCSPHIGHO2_12_FULL_27_8]|nr:MAG: hypothetical protein A3F40_00195 [Chlamydiae bacterium RIFCSPHIGHO2_12_FULL_27_8]